MSGDFVSIHTAFLSRKLEKHVQITVSNVLLCDRTTDLASITKI